MAGCINYEYRSFLKKTFAKEHTVDRGFWREFIRALGSAIVRNDMTSVTGILTSMPKRHRYTVLNTECICGTGSLFLVACIYARTEVVAYMLKISNIAINKVFYISAGPMNRSTPATGLYANGLHVAIILQDRDLAKTLIARGARATPTEEEAECRAYSEAKTASYVGEAEEVSTFLEECGLHASDST